MAIKIFIDQGHSRGGVNGGAVGNGLIEQDITYNVGRILADLLNSDPRFEARTSRSSIDAVLGTNSSSSLAARVALANEWPADYFVSIHTNANTNPLINGTEVYIFRENTPADYLARTVLSSIVDYVGTRDNGVRAGPSLYVLRRTSMPAILVELAYITNPSDAEKLASSQYLFAYSIYIGILNFFGFSAS